MTDSQTASAPPAAAPTAPRGQSSRGRRGRSGRNRGGQSRRSEPRQQQQDQSTRQAGNNQAAASAASQSSSQPASQSEGGSQRQTGNHPAGRGSRGRNRPPRQPRRGGHDRQNRTTVVAPRSFGGQLTAETDGRDSELNAGAPSFVPGQPSESRASASRPAPNQYSKPRAPKSVAADLPTRIHEDIANGHYECVICTSEVLRKSRIWSCSICWTVTHMTCVKKWHSNHLKQEEQRQQERPDAQQQPSSWRCPGCNSSMTEEPSTYHCWCGKEINPKPIAGLDPHSCGQTCSKPRGTCPHPCPLECHAGPCPPCLLMGPSQSCFCGKNVSTKRCGETEYGKGWSCREPCGDLLACGEHECQKDCHSGLCGSCDVPVSSTCYCGREHREIACDERGDRLESFNHGQVDDGDMVDNNDLPESWFWASYDCQNPCNRPFDCGKHFCAKSCHTQDESEAHCPFSPDVVSHCPCGKTPLAEIMDNSRLSCEDVIQNCDKPCGKLLDCGHHCDQKCHTGRCAPCFQKAEVSCRCGRTCEKTLCPQGMLAPPECMRICRAQLNCGRHEHGEHCCPGERRALERLAAKRKNKGSNNVSNAEFEAEHICIRVCGRDLKCGKHQCQQMCHRGPCPSCPEAIFDEIPCNCGRTVLQPPQPCGTQPPECRYDCARARPCGHPQVSHNCHQDDRPCPNCPFLVEKPCICGKKTLKNQPCWFQEPRCGLPCGKTLQCGFHKCRKLCHRDGQCEDVGIAGSHCEQPCLKPRKSCDHEDTERCHAPSACKEDKPCQARTFITCECQHRKQEVKCLASSTNPFPPRMALDCDEECLRLQRNAKLAAALNIDPDSHTDDHVPYSDATLKLFIDKGVQWAQTYEREFRVFAADVTEKRLRFKPMPSHQRAFIHALAEDYGLDSESSDPEPHRHVCLFKTPRFVSAPKKTLAQCARIKASSQELASASQAAAATTSKTAEHAYNALILSTPRFGLTVEELDGALKQDFASHSSVNFQTDFLPSEEVVIKGFGSWTSQTLEATMTSLKSAILPKVRRLDMAKDVSLCHVDSSLNVLRRENDSGSQNSGGWNAVAGRSAARPKPASQGTLGPAPLRSRFVALRKEPKKKVEEPVEEDWEAAAEDLGD